MATWQAFEAACDLRAIGPFKMQAGRGPVNEYGEREIVAPSLQFTSDEPISFEFGLEIVHDSDESNCIIRLTASTQGDFGDLTIGVQAEYEYGEFPSEDLDEELFLAFAQHSAIYAIEPVMRHYVALIARDVLSTDITLALLKRGGVTFEERGEASDASNDR